MRTSTVDDLPTRVHGAAVIRGKAGTCRPRPARPSKRRSIPQVDADYCARETLALERGELVGESGLVARLEGAMPALEALGEVQSNTEVVAERAQSGQSRRLTMREVCSMRWWRVPILVLAFVTASCGGAQREDFHGVDKPEERPVSVSRTAGLTSPSRVIHGVSPPSTGRARDRWGR